MKRNVSGWLIFNKPYDMTSTQAVAKIRWLFGAKKAGHAGTLDPLATGILPIALGEATKTVPAVQDGKKLYRFAIKWGEETTTDDAEGIVSERSSVRPGGDEIRAALVTFTGAIMQTPPAFSAIKVDGERAYDLARAGEMVELQPRPIYVESLQLIEHTEEISHLEMTCEKGTYVRALARDLARHLGTRGHVVKLHRAAVGPFTEARAVTFEALEAAADRDSLLLPVAAGLVLLPEIRLTPEQLSAVRHGNPVLLGGASAPVALDSAWASTAGVAVALGRVEAGQFKPQRVLLG
ncbi:MAG: pseudouridine synthase [Devosia sp.]|uniref:tRNA pseudouridine(55) synthase TruB n=1 Tax=Devosia sp. TaxID=1871048 RepID=UPI00260D2A6D|nr:tRNA pseudouridine(55) synthase TruB [Devosia sp.]MDB5541163.1 pseudouridine synthase [Devosia sp.]